MPAGRRYSLSSSVHWAVVVIMDYTDRRTRVAGNLLTDRTQQPAQRSARAVVADHVCCGARVNQHLRRVTGADLCVDPRDQDSRNGALSDGAAAVSHQDTFTASRRSSSSSSFTCCCSRDRSIAAFCRYVLTAIWHTGPFT